MDESMQIFLVRSHPLFLYKSAKLCTSFHEK